MIRQSGRAYFWVVFALSVSAFLLFAIPNSRASSNLEMVQVFEPDEAMPLPYLLRMIAPAETIDRAIRQFVFYEYYFYGFPHFGFSALLLLPLKWLGQLDNVPWIMLVLRQGTSVLLMLLALMLLVYLQDGFKTYRSPLLFIILLSVPAVVQNNFWWHPDGMVTLLSVLTLYFLEKDNLRLGSNFFLAAVMCGISTAAKNTGVYFFLAVAMVILTSMYQRRISLQVVIWRGMTFIGVMSLTYVLANPFLLSRWARSAFWNIFNLQTELLRFGYGVQYQKGLASWPMIREFYGELVFLLVALSAAIYGAFYKKRLLYALILAWFIPLTLVITFITHFKFQYWLPVALPLISCVAILFPEKLTNYSFSLSLKRILQYAGLSIVIFQLVLFVSNDISRFNQRIFRAENSPSIRFYERIIETLQPLDGKSLRIYRDVRMYLPPKSEWEIEYTFDLLNYAYIRNHNFDILLLMNQRIRDYLNPQSIGIDPEEFRKAQTFYRDADLEKVEGYFLAYRDSFGLIFVKNEYRTFFEAD